MRFALMISTLNTQVQARTRGMIEHVCLIAENLYNLSTAFPCQLLFQMQLIFLYPFVSLQDPLRWPFLGIHAGTFWEATDWLRDISR